MPIAAAIPGIAGGIMGGLAGLGNKRPPSLDPTQRFTLDSLLGQLYPKGRGIGEAQIDPRQQALMFGNIAAQGRGGENRITNQFAARGLGRSGLLAQGLMQNSAGMQEAQNRTDLTLQQQAITQRNETIRQIVQLLGVNNIPGQSNAGAFMAGFAPPAAQGFSQLNFGGGNTTSGGPIWGWPGKDFGA